MHAVLMGDTEIADKIRAARLPATQKYLGHYVSRLDNNSVAQRQMGQGLSNCSMGQYNYVKLIKSVSFE